MNRNALLALIACCTAVALTVASAGVPVGPTDQVHEDLTLAPADTANGGYVFINEQDELELLLSSANPNVEGDGVPADTVTPVHRVFTVTYTGEQSARVWFTDEATDVTFYRDDDPSDSLEERSNSATLVPGETLVVGLLVDTRGEHDVAQADTFTVHAELTEPPTDSSNDASLSSNSITTGTATPTDSPTPTPSPSPTPTTTPLSSATSTPEGESGTTETVGAESPEGDSSPTDDGAAAPTGPSDEAPSSSLAPGIGGIDLGLVALGGIGVGAGVLGAAGLRRLLSR